MYYYYMCTYFVSCSSFEWKKKCVKFIKEKKILTSVIQLLSQNPIMLVKDFELQEVGYQPMQRVHVEEDKHIINLKHFIYISFVTNHYIIFHY
jgi:hypothetical protein